MENENPDLQNPVGTETGLKELVVTYIGERLLAEETVTVDMAVNTMSGRSGHCPMSFVLAPKNSRVFFMWNHCFITSSLFTGSPFIQGLIEYVTSKCIGGQSKTVLFILYIVGEKSKWSEW